MKDITIPGRILKRELIILGCLFIAAWLVDVYAVIKFSGRWTELFTQIGFVLSITAILYLIRLLLWGISYIATRIRARR